MVKLKSKVNIFDIFVVVITVLVISVVAVAYDNKPYLGNKDVLVVVEVSDDVTIDRVMGELEATDVVYYSGTKYPVEQVDYQTTSDTNGDKDLFITLSGLGEISEGDSTFNGQRIFVNQKVELRSDYFVQGYVTEYYYE